MTNVFDRASGSNAEFLGAGYDVIPITPANADLVDPVDSTTYIARGLLCTSAGVATIVTIAGKTRVDVPLQQGYNPIGARRVTAFSGSTIWGIV
jgi:hypothetical protein